jgi:hypothetical protein
MSKTTKITIETSYTHNAITLVDLAPKTWDDVKDWYIKWDTLNVLFEGSDEWVHYALGDGPYQGDDDDWKWPDIAKIHAGHDYENLDGSEEIGAQYGTP